MVATAQAVSSLTLVIQHCIPPDGTAYYLAQKVILNMFQMAPGSPTACHTTVPDVKMVEVPGRMTACDHNTWRKTDSSTGLT